MPFPRLARPREQFVLTDGIWRSIGATRQLDLLVRSMRSIASTSAPTLPKAFTRGRARRRARPGQFSADRPDQES
jgi:hypothetical protein